MDPCREEHCDHSGHDHDPDLQTDNLYQHIDQPNVIALNGTTPDFPKIIKPWHQRTDETISLESDADDQLIIRVPFTGSVKLRSILLKSGPGAETPTKMSIFPNEDNLDFDDISEKKPAQEFDIVQSREVGEYTVKPAKCPEVQSITLFFPAAQGADNVRIYYIGFLGEWREIKDRPTVILYEAQANPADHPKIKGMDGANANLGL
ncbi:hypothetical protein FRB94_010338 [Tulasnella sp. JGI-2019a]|nr:hypothetical protein FRB93_009809 [Tulasnella sp. JGI-2019a]KAG8993829.1 hypothetical protein FRB94_010338 [Tulasnella sp. JGI-2019a]